MLCLSTFSQSTEVKLLGESGDGKTLKLIWFMQSWNNHAQGFDIKRRIAGNGSNWETLNTTPIVPELSVSKNLQNVEPDVAEQARLKAKLQTLISEHKTKEIPSAVYLQKLSADEKAMQGVAFAIALDYDMALLNGFGAIDRSAAMGNTYEYGLFYAADKNEALSTFNWVYGTKAMLDNAAVNIESGIMAKPLKIQLKWAADAATMKGVQAAGFNVYKKNGSEWVKLNTTTLNAQVKDGFVYTDNSITDRNKAETYAVSLVSIFGNEGNKTEHTYNPLLHPLEHKAVELGEIKSAGKNFEKGFELNWNFPAEYEKYVKGFVVEKANMPGGYKQVSDTIPATQRVYNEKTFSPPASYVSFRVYAIYNDAAKMKGNEQLYYYLPTIYAPSPSRLTGKWIKENGKTYIDLSWDNKATGDSLTEGYQLYASNRFDNQMYWENSLPLIRQSQYRYEVFNNNATNYRFCIAAVSKYKAVGSFSDTITIQAPTVSLPVPVIYPYTVDSAKVTLNWNYPGLADLKGFRIYQNGNLVANEFQLLKGVNRFISPQLQQGATYRFALKAVTENGVESDLSIQREVYVQ